MKSHRLLIGIFATVLTFAPAHAQSWSQFKAAGMWKEAWQSIEALGAKDPRYFTTLRSFAAQLRKEGKPEQAEALYKKALLIVTESKDASGAAPAKLSAYDSEARQGCLLDYTQMLADAKRQDEADKVKQIADAMAAPSSTRQSGSADTTVTDADNISFGRSQVATTNSDYERFMKEGTTYLASKNFPMARQSFEQALSKLNPESDPSSSRQLLVLGKLIQVDYATDNLTGAESTFQKVLSRLKRKNSNSVDYARALQNHGALLRQLGKREQAMKEEYQAGVILADLQQSNEVAKQASEREEAGSGALFPGGRTRRNFGINGMRR